MELGLAWLCFCVQVMVAEALDISRETYFAILMDRSYNGPVMVGSPQGGVDIEEVAASNPELIFKVQNVCSLQFITCCVRSGNERALGGAGHSDEPN